jgi:bacillithiol system protein YtxJ
LKDRTETLRSPAEVDAFLKAHPLAVLFKAGTCHRTTETLARLRSLLEARADVPFGLIRVVEARPASDHVAARTGIQHESPQLLVFREGEVILSRSHREIDEQSLAAALDGRLAAV